MNGDEKKRVRERTRTAKSFLKTADYLDSRPPLPMKPRKNVPLTTPEEVAENEYYGAFIVASRFHRALVFEIGIKLVWELENAKECEHTHDIHRLYCELSGNSQTRIEEIYKKDRGRMEKEVRKIMAKAARTWKGRINPYCSLEEALHLNKSVVTNFKYDGQFDWKNIVFQNALFDADKETLWTLPQTHQSHFLENLFEYIEELSNI